MKIVEQETNNQKATHKQSSSLQCIIDLVTIQSAGN
jgi:hypothetical protein